MTRSTIDWQAIQQEWVVGRFSNVQIGAKFGISEKAIRKRIKAEGWTRDDGQRYRSKVEAKLIEKAAAAAKVGRRADAVKANAEDAAELAADVGAQVVECHRKDVAKARTLVNTLFEQLTVAVVDRDLLINLAEQANSGDNPKISDRDLKRIWKTLDLTRHATTARDLALAMKTLITSERTAFGLDKADKDADGSGVHVHYDVQF